MFPPPEPSHPIPSRPVPAGVASVEADVAAKTVTVSSNGATTKEAMLEALKKWSTASGKTVELAS